MIQFSKPTILLSSGYLFKLKKKNAPYPNHFLKKKKKDLLSSHYVQGMLLGAKSTQVNPQTWILP